MLTIQEQASLQSLNTLGIDSTASHLIDITHSERIPDAVFYAQQQDLDIVVLGEGSNVILPDTLSSLVIRMANKGRLITQHSDEHSDIVYVSAEAGENWHELVGYCLDNNLYGLENLSLIPGTVGAAPIQNIGAYGVELMDVFESLRGWHCEKQCWQEMNKADCQFAYRDSIFKGELKGRFIITSVTFKLSKNPLVKTDYAALQNALNAEGIKTPSPQQVADIVTTIRQSKLPDPKHLANSGSFFKNPIVDKEQCDELLKKYPELVYYPQPDGRVKLAAGWLLEKAGWKGLRAGNVGMHQQQALVLINYQGASSAEVLLFAQTIQQDIHNKFAVELVIEPAVIQS